MDAENEPVAYVVFAVEGSRISQELPCLIRGRAPADLTAGPRMQSEWIVYVSHLAKISATTNNLR